MNWVSKMGFRVKAILRRDAVLRDIEQDIRQHITLEQERLRAEGLSGREARDLARNRFGNVTRLQQELQSISGVKPRAERHGGGSLIKDFKHSVRSLMKAPAYSAAVVVTLSIALGANMVMFSVAENVLLDDAGVRYPSEVVSIHNFIPQLGEGMRRQPVHGSFFDRFTRLEGIEYVAGFRTEFFNFSADDRPVRLEGLRTTPDLFRVAGVSPMIGVGFPEGLVGNEKVVVLSHKVWSSLFGADPAIVGRLVNFNGEPYEVVGVMPADFGFPRGIDVPSAFHFPDRPDLWIPHQVPLRGPSDLGVVARVVGEGGVALLQERLDALTEAVVEENSGWDGFATHRVLPIQEQAVGQIRPIIVGLFAATGLILLVAAANVSGVSFTRGYERSNQLAIRVALGASRWMVVRYLLFENAILAIGSVAGGLAVGWASAEILQSVAPEGIRGLDTLAISVKSFVFVALLGTLSAAIFGAFPSIKLSELASMGTLSTQRVSGQTTARMGDWVVGGEVAVTVVLVLVSGLLFRTVVGLLENEPGFDPVGVMVAEVTLPEASYPDAARAQSVQRARSRSETEGAVSQFYRLFLNDLREHPDVTHAGAVSPIPMGGTQEASAMWLEGMDPGASAPVIELTVASEGYFEAMGLDLLEGRTFDTSDRHDGLFTAVISESVANMWPNGAAVGSRLKLGGVPDGPREWRTVVGIVGDVRRGNLAEIGRPEVYFPLTQGGYTSLSTMHLVVRGRAGVSAEIAARATRDALRQVNASLPLEKVSGMENLIERQVSREKLAMQLLAAFSTTSLLLSVLSLYSVVSHSVNSRRREFAIRQAVGASPGSVLLGVMLRAGGSVFIGGLTGVLVVAFLSPVIGGFLYGVKPLEVGVVAVAVFTVFFVASVAAYVPAIRVTRIDPVECLRVE